MTKQEERWRQAFGAYESLRGRVLAQVARWEWADDERYDPRPLYFERSKLRRGQVLERVGNDFSGLWQHGFDAADRLIAARGYPARALHEDQCLEDFYIYGDRLIESVRFAQFQPKTPIRVAHQSWSGGQLEQYAAFSVELGPVMSELTPDQALRLAAEQNGVSQYQERYIYQDGRLARIEVRHAWGGELFAHEELVSHDKLGRVQTIEATYADGSPQTIYRRPEPSYGVGTPAGRIYQRLLEAVPRRLARAKVRDKVYCLALLYTAGSVQPRLALGFEKTRADLARKRGGAGLISALWQPNDAVVELDDPALESDRAIFEQQIAISGDMEPARELLCHLALALTECKWKGVLNTTKDFVVFAANPAQDRPDDALAASVPPKQLTEFRRRGWL